MPLEPYTFDEETYDALDQAGIPALSATDVLYSARVVRRHIGSFLQVAGQDRHGTWLAIALIETDDDHYTVTSARHLDPTEIAVIKSIREDQS